MNDDNVRSELVQNLEDSVSSLNETNTQMQALYDTIKKVKNEKDKDMLVYVYKQTYDALNKYTKAFRKTIEVVKNRVEENEQPQTEE